LSDQHKIIGKKPVVVLFSDQNFIPTPECVNNDCIKGIVQRKLTGVKSGANQKALLKATVAKNIKQICPSPILCEAKNF
jgi:hypothetical protein